MAAGFGLCGLRLSAHIADEAAHEFAAAHAVGLAGSLVQLAIPFFGFQQAFVDLKAGVAEGALHDDGGFFGAGGAFGFAPQFEFVGEEAAVTALGAVDGQLALVSPVTDGAGVDAQDFGSFAKT